MERVQEAFELVLFVVVGLAVVAALASLPGRGRLYDQIGRGGLSIGDEPGRPQPGQAALAAVRDEEIRQMLDARNARRERHGMPALDLDAELARLQAPAHDPALAAEVRQLVVARNERRARAGRPALDVEAEVARRMADLAEG